MDNMKNGSPEYIARLTSAYEKVSSTRRMLKLASIWDSLKHPYSLANILLCLKKAEFLANSISEWGLIAESYGHIVPDGEPFNLICQRQAAYCMRKAEGLAKVSLDWLDCACFWQCSDIECQDEILRCLQLALDKAQTSEDYSGLAFNCVMLFNNIPPSKSLIQKAEQLARSTEDWQLIRQCYEAVDDTKKWDGKPEIDFDICDGKIIKC